MSVFIEPLLIRIKKNVKCKYNPLRNSCKEGQSCMEWSDFKQDWNTLGGMWNYGVSGYCVDKINPQNPTVCDNLECTKKNDRSENLN